MNEELFVNELCRETLRIPVYATFSRNRSFLPVGSKRKLRISIGENIKAFSFDPSKDTQRDVSKLAVLFSNI